MPSRKTRITQRVVDALSVGGLVWDTAVAGFGVRRQRRDKIFVLKARVGRRQRWFTIGKHGSPWTVDKARREAKAILGEIERGQDPATQRDFDAKTPTLGKIAEDFLKEVEAKRKPATAVQYRDFLERLAIPRLG